MKEVLFVLEFVIIYYWGIRIAKDFKAYKAAGPTGKKFFLAFWPIVCLYYMALDFDVTGIGERTKS